MSEAPLKVGDRVRIHGLENDGDIFSTNVGTYIECPELDGMTGTIIEVNKDGYIVREDSGREEDFIGACLTRIERPRRTFEEICKELAVKLGQDWEMSNFSSYIDFLCGNIYITMFPKGDIAMHEILFTAEQISAISAACAELAANWEAEHGKENQQ